jgi:serine/threonine-protein kinase
MPAVDFVLGIILVLVLATTAWMVWSAHRGRPGRSAPEKSPQRTIDDQALAAKLAGSIWTRLAELKSSGIQLSLRSRLEAASSAPVAERLLVLQEVLLDLERLQPKRPLLSHSSGAGSAGGTPSGEVLELLKLPPGQRSGFIGRAIVAGIEPLLASSMGPRSAEAFIRAMGPLPGPVDEWSMWVEKRFLADLFARMLERSKTGIGPEALLKILEQSASAVGARFPLACFPTVIANFPEGLLERERIACAARETLWQELAPPAASEATPFSKCGPPAGGPAAMTCSFCHAPLLEQTRYCMTCGADLSDPSVSTHQRAAVKELFEVLQTAVMDRYRVADMLGRGGMGAVFLAEDLRLGRMVAIKILRPELADDSSFVRRFEREARIAAQLDHPNIIPVYAVEQFEDFHYFVMKYVAGKSLDELLTGQPLPVEEARQILWQAARALGHAHQRGVIHRDVKPSNIMLEEGGRVILTDFGISKALLSDTQYTSTGQLIGTPRYISPEQVRGMDLDGRSDQYSLAVVGYQMLIGRLPLIASTVHALMYKHVYEVPTAARVVRPEIPLEISDALQRALSKQPDERFPTMEAFATALRSEQAVGSGPHR